MVSMSNSPAPVAASTGVLTQDELKTLVGRAALDYVVRGQWVGVGTGSTVNKFIEALGSIRHEIPGAVSSSVASTERLRALGIEVRDANEVERLAVYIDDIHFFCGGEADIGRFTGSDVADDALNKSAKVSGRAVVNVENDGWVSVVTDSHSFAEIISSGHKVRS